MAGDSNPENTNAQQEKDSRNRGRSWFEGFVTALFQDRVLTEPSPQQAASPPPEPPATRPLPAMADPVVQFCCEDTVKLKDDPDMVGVVDRSFGDVDSHEPRPQREYESDIERHPDIPENQFSKFMRDGIPPRGTVLVSWQTVYRFELIPEARLELLDRALYVGDVVKRNPKDAMSGTVIGTSATCSLLPVALQDLTPAMVDEHTLRHVPASELLNVHEYTEGALVVYHDWVGKIEDVTDEVAVKLANNSVVVVESPEELVPEDAVVERLSVGDKVNTKKFNLRRGLWKYGSFSPNVRPTGVVVETRTVRVAVNWLGRRLGSPTGSQYDRIDEPPTVLDLDELESPHFRVYDATCGAACTLPMTENGPSYHVADVSVGDRVRFKDLPGAAVKYDGSRKDANGHSEGRLVRIPRTDSLGYDMNVFVVTATDTRVTVQWQDLTVTEHPSTALIPDPNVGDDDEVWPGEIVCTNEERKDKGSDLAWTFQPEKVGVVQAVQSRDRIATVRWFESHDIRFIEEDMLPISQTGNLREDTEDVSLYDIRSIPSLTRRRGDFVMIHTGPDTDPLTLDPKTGQHDWFGEIVDLGLNGKLTVRLGASHSVRDIEVASEHVTMVYSEDMNSHPFVPELDEVDYTDDYEEESDFDSASFNEMWIEYEGMEGEPIGTYDDDAWSTEESDADDSDDSMPDLEDIDDMDTSRTDAETHSDGGREAAVDQAPTNGLPPQKPRTEAPNLESPEHPTETDSEELAPFLVLDTPPPTNHYYINSTSASSSAFLKRIAKEHKILSSSLPPGILVRTWESRLDLIRVLMIGPADTPYEHAPFLIDFHLGSSYPSDPPEAFFHSWTTGTGPVNPNLYEDGKICLSLLGTWHADERNESWSSSKSTLLQVLVSIHSLVLNREPYYNEAGYDVHREAPETKLSSALYTERAYFRARGFIVHALTHPIDPFSQELVYLYLSKKEGAPQLLQKVITAAKEIIERSEVDDGQERDGLTRISRGAVVMLRRQVEKLEEIVEARKDFLAQGGGEDAAFVS